VCTEKAKLINRPYFKTRWVARANLGGIIDGKNHSGRPRLQHISQVIEDELFVSRAEEED